MLKYQLITQLKILEEIQASKTITENNQLQTLLQVSITDIPKHLLQMGKYYIKKRNSI